MSTEIGKAFLQLIDKHFPLHHKLHKIFNKNTEYNDNEYKYYLGLAETTFKERHNNHKKSFKNVHYKNNTELSKYIWLLTENGKTPKIKWKIIHIIVRSKIRPNFCKLCLMEKYYILYALGDDNCLNKRSEFVNKCRHQTNYF